MADVTLVSADTRPNLNATLKDDQTGDPIDLTDATSVLFRMRKPDDRRFTVNAPADITDAPNGRVRYSWAANDLSDPGIFQGRFHIIWNDATQQSTNPANVIEIVRR